jgi:hypothetical protein
MTAHALANRPGRDRGYLRGRGREPRSLALASDTEPLNLTAMTNQRCPYRANRVGFCAVRIGDGGL